MYQKITMITESGKAILNNTKHCEIFQIEKSYSTVWKLGKVSQVGVNLVFKLAL